MTDSHGDPDGVLPSRQGHDRVDVEWADPRDVLARVRMLEIGAWRASTGDAGGIDRFAPAVEQFHEIFEVAPGADRVAAGDADGVAMAAIQALANRVDEQDRQLRRQHERLDEQRTDLETLRERVESLQSELARLELDSGGSE